MPRSSSKSPASKSKSPARSKSKSKSPSSTSKRERIDILVPCHSYLNEPLKYSGPHDPVFLFLYNEKAKRYDKINITDVPALDSDEEDGQGEATLKSLEQNENIHIKFIDDAVLDKDVNEYQYNKKEQLISQTFDYIFPIHCTGNSAQNYKSFLKPTGKLLDPVFQVSEDYLNTLKPAALEQLKTEIISARKTFVPYENGQHRIEFHKYRESNEPYIYKEDIVDGYGWYNVYYAPPTKSLSDNPYVSKANSYASKANSYASKANPYASPGGSGTQKRSTQKRSTQKRKRKGKKGKKSIRHKKRF